MLRGFPGAAIAVPLLIAAAALPGDRAPSPSRAAESSARSIVAGLPGVISWRDIPRGDYLLDQYRHVILLEQGAREIQAIYTHKTQMLGKLADGDKVRVDEPRLPPSLGYSADLALQLPTRLTAAAGGASWRQPVYYEPFFSHVTGDSRPFWTWSMLQDASRGRDPFSIFGEERRAAGPGGAFYGGTVKELGEVYGWVQLELGGVLDVTLYLERPGARPAPAITMITARYVDTARVLASAAGVAAAGEGRASR